MRIFSFLLLIFSVYFLNAQTAETEQNTFRDFAPKVFIDCGGDCDVDFIKQEAPFLNYVRDRKVANVHVLITDQQTGSGGEEITVTFIGQIEFKGMNDTLIFNISPNDTEQEILEKALQIFKIGMVRYVAKTPLNAMILIDFDTELDPTAVEDKWNNWTFDIDVGGWFNGQESIKTMNTWGSFGITRTTPEWKLEFDFDAGYNESQYNIGDETVVSLIRSQEFEGLIVKSLGEHFSVGGFMDAESSIFENLRFSYEVKPAFEYNLFKYSESTRKQLRFLYTAGYKYNYYNDTTIFNKTEEMLFEEGLGISLKVREKWGSVSTSLRGTHYFHDFSLNRLILHVSMNVRLLKGLSFNIGGNISLIHDQISLQKEGASEEDILLQQRQLATQYRYWGHVGLSYTFGSIYNTVVNPRFGN